MAGALTELSQRTLSIPDLLLLLEGAPRQIWNTNGPSTCFTPLGSSLGHKARSPVHPSSTCFTPSFLTISSFTRCVMHPHRLLRCGYGTGAASARRSSSSKRRLIRRTEPWSSASVVAGSGGSSEDVEGDSGLGGGSASGAWARPEAAVMTAQASGGGTALPTARSPARLPEGSFQPGAKPISTALSATVRQRTVVPSRRAQISG